MNQHELDLLHMRRAIQLAAQAEGYVEPNPLVGCVIADHEQVLAEGWHRKFGGPHAEVEALGEAGRRAAGATMVVSLEPCCHHGKTPPCSRAIINAGIRRVVIAHRDPFPEVSGGGIAELEQAGVEVQLGVLQDEARQLNGPYLKLVRDGRPWIIAKWAMTLDGKLATREGDSRWISGQASREVVHKLRGRVDGVMIGSGTAKLDDPLLTARPPGPRIAARIVVDSRALLAMESQLVRTARDAPVLVAVGPESRQEDRRQLTEAGCQVILCEAATHGERLAQLLDELGRQRMTNLLVEGGGQLLGSLLDAGQIDELHVFLAPKLIGGAAAPGPMVGEGIAHLADAIQLDTPLIEQLGHDIHIHGRIRRSS